MQEDEALLTLNWVINKWASHHPFSIIILFINSSSPHYDFVYTPFGKLPASSVSDDKLKILRKCEQEKIDQLLSKCIAFCGKVKAEVHKVDKKDESIQKTVVDLILEFRITKLVLGMTLSRSSSGSKSGISGSFYVHRNKPEYCGLYIVSRGKLVVIKEENEEGHMEDEEGVVVAKLKQRGSLRGWLGKMLHQGGHGRTQICPSSSRSSNSSLDSDSPVSRNNKQWETYEPEIDEYLKELLGSSSRKDKQTVVPDESTCVDSPTDINILDCLQDGNDRIEALKKEIQTAKQMIESNKNEAKAEVDKQAKALWAICLCNHRAEELEAHINEEVAARNDITRGIDNTKEQLYEILTDVDESKNRLSSLLELQSELSSKLRVSSLAKLGAEAQLENAATTRVELVREIEELRKQRDIFNRRIEFCKEKDAIELVSRMSSDQVTCSFREFSADDLRLATDNFATYMRLSCGRAWSRAYKGRINRLSVAIKVVDPDTDLSEDMFRAKVNLLANIRHPHIISFLGFCSELKCLVFEYMYNGCLRDILFSRTKSRSLQWHQRLQIAAQVSLGLGFLHQAKPRPVVYSGINPSCIFLDKNLVAKIHPFELTPCCEEDEVLSDVSAFGDLLLQLLTGRNWAQLDCEAMVLDKQVLLEALDGNAGEWPVHIAQGVVELAMKCRTVNSEISFGLTMSSVSKELNKLKKKADDVITRREHHTGSEDDFCYAEESTQVPPLFICPIFQVVMDNPHIAADGYSYELEAIEEWLGRGHDISPVTNQKLKHKNLVPNKNLRFLIQDWRSSSS